MLKRIVLAAIAAAATILPVGAEIQDSTASLLRTLDQNGILVTINHEACSTNQAHGQYRWVGIRRELRLCPGETVDAIDHKTVRHETMHAIQHCVNSARGTDFNLPTISDEDVFTEFVTTYLSPEVAQNIFELYPQEHWLVELEAFAAAEAFTAAELEKMFLLACVAN